MSKQTHWTAEDVAFELAPRKARRAGRGFLTCCPAHDDNTPSLSLNEAGDGRVLFHCFAGCEPRDIIAILRERGIDIVPSSGDRSDFPRRAPPPRPARKRHSAREERLARFRYDPQRAGERPPLPSEIFPRHGRPPHGARITGTWTWHDEAGRALFRTIRIDTQAGKELKPIIPCTDIHTGRLSWELRGPPAPRLLYDRHLDEGQATVVVVEGEKTAEAAKRIFRCGANGKNVRAVHVTTSLGGNNAADYSNWAPLAGRAVIIAHDLDDPGLKYAAAVSRQAQRHGAKSSHLWNPPTRTTLRNGIRVPRTVPPKEGYDLADSLEEGWTLELLMLENVFPRIPGIEP